MMSLAALLLAAAQPQAPRAGYHHLCQTYLPNFDGGSSSLTLLKFFRADGPILSVYVQAPSVVRGSRGLRPEVKLRWPETNPFNWAGGRIEFASVGGAFDTDALPNDLARRTLVDRGGALRPALNSETGTLEIFVPAFEPHLASEPLNPALAPNFHISVDSLLAWGAGQSSLTVYETIISARPQPGRGLTLFGRERVTTSYEIDVPALTRLVAQVRAATERWEARLADDRSRCSLEPDEGLTSLPN